MNGYSLLSGHRSQDDDIKTLITKLSAEISETKVRLSKLSSTSKDWTHIYELSEKYVDLSDLEVSKAMAEKKLEVLQGHTCDPLEHTHDHKTEREFFDLAEPMKLAKCRQQKSIADLMVNEGSHDRAVSYFRTVLSFCDYCFPDDETSLQCLSVLRSSCFQGLSLSLLLIGEYRECIEAASMALLEVNMAGIVYLYRALAFKALQDYEYVVSLQTIIPSLIVVCRFRNCLADIRQASRNGIDCNEFMEEVMV